MNLASQKLTLNDAKTFSGNVWKMIHDEMTDTLFVETRDVSKKQVCFSAYSFQLKTWLWTEISFDEPWWISLAYVKNNVLLLTVYDDTNNPERKSIIAVDVATHKIIWWKSNFEVAHITEESVTGIDTKFGAKKVAFHLKSGEVLQPNVTEIDSVQNFTLIRPLQYLQGTSHFSTVKAFVERKCKFSVIDVVEYCEHEPFIIVSVFVQQEGLANYLIVFNSEGEIVLKEQLGENLKGIAYDTFFLLAGFIIFVKNKRELVSYKIA